MFAIRLTTVAVAAVAFAAVVVGAAVLGTVTSEAQPLPVAQAGAEKIVMTCQSEIGEQSDICLMNPDGSALERLTDTAVSERSPGFSPDGQRIAWSVNPTFDIWVMDVDGSAPQRIFQPSFDHPLGDSPTWAPTGDRIAFKCSTAEICVMRSDGTDLESLVKLDFPSAVDDLDWSPDGSTIVFGCGSRVCTVQSDGTNLVELPGGAGDGEPAWSPDGSLIAFAGRVTLFKQGLLVMNADGTNRRTLYSGGTGLLSGGGGVSDPVWSPDGSQIAATCLPPGGGAFALCFIDLNGGGLTTVSQGDEAWWDYDWAVVGGAAPAPPAASVSHSLTLLPGGNLVGWTGATPVAEATASMAGQYDAIFTFDPETQAFRVFRPASLPILNSLANLALGDGVWINVTDPNGAVWQVPVVDAPRAVSLAPQFNLVVWTGADGTPVGEAVVGILDALDALFMWDPRADEFLSYRPGAPAFLNTADVLNYGDGVWLKMTAPAVWEQPASGLGVASR